jgi:hypothetical protein
MDKCSCAQQPPVQQLQLAIDDTTATGQQAATKQLSSTDKCKNDADACQSCDPVSIALLAKVHVSKRRNQREQPSKATACMISLHKPTFKVSGRNPD